MAYDQIQIPQVKQQQKTGNKEIDAMVEANIAFAEQLAILNILLQRISSNTQETNDFFKNADGFNVSLDDALKDIRETVTKIQENVKANAASIASNSPQFISTKLEAKIDALKTDIDKKLELSTKTIGILFAGTAAIFGFIVYIIDKVFGVAITQSQLTQIATEIAKQIGK